MNIIDIQTATSKGPRESQQDVFRIKDGYDGSKVLGIFDGHGDKGDVVAEHAANMVDAIAESSVSFESHLSRKAYLRSLIRMKHEELFESMLYEHQDLEGSGTTATIGLFRNDRLTVANVGDSEAYFYADDGEAIALTTPHTINHLPDVRRIRRMGYRTFYNYFILSMDDVLSVSRSIGDTHLPFVSHRASVSTRTLHTPGTLVIATDGVWGIDYESDHGALHNGSQETVREWVRSADRTQEGLEALTEELAKVNEDNATAIVARIE